MRLLGLAVLGAWLAAPGLRAVSTQEPANELDAFMARALERREESWRKLHDYVLDEREQFTIVGPGRVRLHGLDREFTWYVRDGFFVRSPVRANGVVVPEAERREYEDRWFAREKARAERRRAQSAGQDPDEAGGSPDEPPEIDGPSIDADSLVRQGGEPRFVSEAFFLKFKFEPGNYYLVGRETLDGREVLRIEYYPRRLFSGDNRDRGEEQANEINLAPQAAPPKPGQPAAEADREQTHREERRREPGEVDERDIERRLDKVALITLWVEPASHQIVKYTFDNVGLDFLPGRWLVRFDDLRASMTMGRYFETVWLPREIRFEGGFTLASGSYALQYVRTFSDYRQAETRAIIRGYTPKDP